jgi:hypothetical protein
MTPSPPDPVRTAPDAGRDEARWWREHAEQLDRNWAAHHEATLRPIRAALGLPDGSIPDLLAAIEALKAAPSPARPCASADAGIRPRGPAFWAGTLAESLREAEAIGPDCEIRLRQDQAREMIAGMRDGGLMASKTADDDAGRLLAAIRRLCEQLQGSKVSWLSIDPCEDDATGWWGFQVEMPDGSWIEGASIWEALITAALKAEASESARAAGEGGS